MQRPINLEPEGIFTFVRRELPDYKGELTMGTRIGEDLRLIGDDADEFLDKFSKEFAVDLSEFPFSDYFPDEGSASMHFYTGRQMNRPENPALSLLRKLDSLIWGLFARRHSFKTLTVQDLYESARTGRWHPKF
ncbi:MULTISPECIES: DUF1493 family protein [Pseudomonas aeruginosa group]|uniref:DUF1493 family protein n=1 Tax=Pseudomonas aeruginosa group TaxID=136841 RepID=UPI0008FB5A93|nr:hypothetical protein AO903_33030 [Pseudomonas aeruginosa]OPE22365.1 hypothetical protein APA88_34870 [Pseudomonas aeruginosa]